MNKPIHPVIGSDGGNAAYDADPYGWAIEQAGLLRAGRIDLVDWSNIAEEIEDVARSERKTAESALQLAIKHILKWQTQPERRDRSWQTSIRNGRAKYRDTIEDNPSLAAAADEMLDKAMRRARRDAAAEMGIGEDQLADQRLTWDVILNQPFVIER